MTQALSQGLAVYSIMGWIDWKYYTRQKLEGIWHGSVVKAEEKTFVQRQMADTVLKFNVKRTQTWKSHLSFAFIQHTAPRPTGGRMTSVHITGSTWILDSKWGPTSLRNPVVLCGCREAQRCTVLKQIHSHVRWKAQASEGCMDHPLALGDLQHMALLISAASPRGQGGWGCLCWPSSSCFTAPCPQTAATRIALGLQPRSCTDRDSSSAPSL